jgi:uncharacterized repeat protein (TIGR03803 family)
MRSSKLSRGLTAVLASTLVTLLAASTLAAAQQETVLHSFGSSTRDGIVPEADLIIDSSGNLYGTAVQGGTGSCPGGPTCGNVFELSPKAGGGWTEKILHQFTNNAKDGYQPRTSLVMDSAGNLYGTTAAGGVHGFGTVFELTPKAGGLWIEKVLFSFYLQTGGLPYGGLTLDAAGNLYGTTSDGGAYHNTCGTVFELKHPSAGVWSQQVLHVFNLDGVDGCSPQASLIFDAAGNLYGTTIYGGNAGGGTVFEFTPSTGTWTEQILHNFVLNSTDGSHPKAHLISDSAGNLYGTTYDGGAGNGGIVYQLMPGSGGSWSEVILHSFNWADLNGSYLFGGLAQDSAGNLYGTTADGGTGSCSGGSGCGTVFELTPATGGSWNWTLLYPFAGNPDGAAPFAGLISDSVGNLYGTTAGGGPYSKGALGGGTAFEFTP